jgi:hypothetical protein
MLKREITLEILNLGTIEVAETDPPASARAASIYHVRARLAGHERHANRPSLVRGHEYVQPGSYMMSTSITSSSVSS